MGRRPTLIIGLVGYALASALAGSAGDSLILVVARLLQGVAGALVTPSALALVVSGFTDAKERRTAFGVYAVIAGGGSALGLAAGGWLLEILMWRWSLYTGVALAVIILVGALTLPRDAPRRTDARPDTVGTLLGTGGLLALTYGLSEGEPRGWTVPLVVVPLVLGIILLVVFLAWQTTRTESIPAATVASSEVRGHDRLGCFLAMLLAGVGALLSFAVLAFSLPSVGGYAPVMVGAAFLPMIVALVIGSTQVSARLMGRVAPRVLIVPGLVITAVGMLFLTGLEADAAYAAQILPGMVLTGFGTGLAFMPLLAVATAAVGPHRAGAVSAAITAAQHLGLMLGSAVLSTVVTASLHAVPAEELTGELLGAYTATLPWAIGSVLLAGLMAGLVITVKAPGGRRG
ncbi:MFS transporter [Streptomyces finlayi]|uniref:MFS transporter n=1 Tax=Streptomyces finlayi TaxID=67296 RepID=UPI0021560B72|nr:MFS transporter [Streptomyces finlayi]